MRVEALPVEMLIVGCWFFFSRYLTVKLSVPKPPISNISSRENSLST